MLIRFFQHKALRFFQKTFFIEKNNFVAEDIFFKKEIDVTSYIINGIVSVTSTYCCARVIKLKNPFEIALLMTVHNLFLQEMEVFVECLDKEVDEHEHYTKVLIQVVRLATVIGSIPAIFWLAKKMEISTPNTKTYLGMSLGAGVLSYASLNVLSSSSS